MLKSFGPNSIDSSSALSWITSSYISPLINRSKGRRLSFSDVEDPPKKHCSESINDSIVKDLLAGTHPINAFVLTNKWQIFMCLLSGIFHSFFLQMIPICVEKILEYLCDDKIAFPGHLYAALLTCLVLLLSQVLSALSMNICFTLSTYIGSDVRAATMIAVQNKMLKLSPGSRKLTSYGDLVTLFSVDSERLWNCCIYMHWWVIAPLTMILTCVMMYSRYGWPAFIPFILTLGVVLGNLLTSLSMAQIRRKMIGVTTERVKLQSESLQGIRVVKLYGWESAVRDRVRFLRSLELKKLKSFLSYMSFNIFFINSLSVIMTALTIFSIVYGNGEVMSTTNTYTVLAFIGLLRLPTIMTPNSLRGISEALVSVERLKKFMSLPEIDNSVMITDELDYSSHPSDNNTYFLNNKDSTYDVSMTGAFVSWESGVDGALASGNQENLEEQEKESVKVLTSNDLKDITTKILRNSVCIIIGPTGSGKSTLLATLLGLLKPDIGDVSINGRISYAGQEAWVRNCSVKDNILFGSEYDEEKYKNVLSAAQLEHDMTQLPAGDLTEVGERGITLSGGQKARVAFARALYRIDESDIFILDDPLSAVDMHVARAMFEQAILGFLKNKTVILTLNSHYDLLEYADQIILLSDGAIQAQGSLSEVEVNPMFSTAYQPYLSKPNDQTPYSPSLSVKSSLPIYPKPPDLTDEDESEENELLIKTPQGADDMYLSEILQKNAANSNIDLDIPLRAARGLDHRHSVDFIPRQRTNSFTSQTTSQTTATRSTGIHSAASKNNKVQTENYKNKSGLEKIGHSNTRDDLLSGKDEKFLEKEAGFHSALELFKGIFNDAGHVVATLFCFLYILSFSSISIMRYAVDLSMGMWVKRDNQGDLKGSNNALHAYLWCFGVFIFLCAIKQFIFIWTVIRASRSLHDVAFSRVLRAPVPSFFDVVPLGRVINRFSRDQDQVDLLLPEVSSMFLADGSILIVSLLACLIACPWMIIIMIPVGYFFQKMAALFGNASTSLKQLEALARSPLYIALEESFIGYATIKAFRMTNYFKTEMNKLVNNNTRVFLSHYLASRWFAIRADLVCCLISFSIAILCVFLKDFADPTLVALALCASVQLTGLLQWVIRVMVDTRNNLTAVDRIAEYKKLKSEAPLLIGLTPLPYDNKLNDNVDDNDDEKSGDVDNDQEIISESSNSRQSLNDTSVAILGAPSGWPQFGKVEFQNVWVKYRPGLKWALKNMNFTILPGEKIGICGRSGAGKSTILQALFRLTEPNRGRILIDDIDTRTVGLHTLRSRLAVIPQDPVLLSGTIRQNLDPYGKESAASLWEVLEIAHLASSIRAMYYASGDTEKQISLSNATAVWKKGHPGWTRNSGPSDYEIILAYRVAERGENFSVGQRQLICVARALLKKAKVILLDEATANVDTETDSLIQEGIRKGFGSATVITVAHRLDTIIHCDKILVVTDGKVGEFDAPKELLRKQKGFFKSLVDELPIDAKDQFYKLSSSNLPV